MKKRSSVLLVVVAALASTSCAAMFSGTSETIYLRSEEPGTRFFANERDLGIGSSAVVNLSKKQLGRTTLRAVKEGCTDRSSPIQTAFDPVTLLGLFVDFGIITIVGVDWLATGAVTKAGQTEYVLTPECQTALLNHSGLFFIGQPVLSPPLNGE